MHFLPVKFYIHVQEITRLYSRVESEADEDAKWQPPLRYGKTLLCISERQTQAKKKCIYFVRVRNCKGQ